MHIGQLTLNPKLLQVRLSHYKTKDRLYPTTGIQSGMWPQVQSLVTKVQVKAQHPVNKQLFEPSSSNANEGGRS